VNPHTDNGESPRHSRFGYTLIELLVAMVIGAVILAAAVGFLITHMRTLEGSDIRENVTRNSRYIGALLRHDLQAAGIEIESRVSFGTISVWPGPAGDTLLVLFVPYLPSPAPARPVDVTLSEPPAGEGTCGPRCIDVMKDPDEVFELEAGDLARLEVQGTRRLIIVSEVGMVHPGRMQVSFTEADTLLHQPAGLIDDLQLRIPGSFVQELKPTVFYLDDQERLMRAERLSLSGSPVGEVVAYGVEQFDVSVVFADGDEQPRPNPADTDVTNDYDDIVAVKVTVTVKADRTDPRVNNGELLRKTMEWRISPRNLRYEKNRM
jgi:prepilin-type N-terminal cleavage/methylation domain-containing protein